MICRFCQREALKAGRSTASAWSCTTCHKRQCRHEPSDLKGRCSWCVAEAGDDEKRKGDAA